MHNKVTPKFEAYLLILFQTLIVPNFVQYIYNLASRTIKVEKEPSTSHSVFLLFLLIVYKLKVQRL